MKEIRKTTQFKKDFKRISKNIKKNHSEKTVSEDSWAHSMIDENITQMVPL